MANLPSGRGDLSGATDPTVLLDEGAGLTVLPTPRRETDPEALRPLESGPPLVETVLETGEETRASTNAAHSGPSAEARDGPLSAPSAAGELAAGCA